MPEKSDDKGSHLICGRCGRSTYYMFSTVKGLLSEKGRFSDSYHETVPDALALPISGGELAALKTYRGEPVEMTTPERVYSQQLSRFGEVRIPHPVYTACVEIAKEDVIPIYALDMDDISFSETYVRHITGFQMISTSIKEKTLMSRQFRARNPFDFVIEWDRAINSSKGYRQLELARERHMAGRITELLQRHRVLLAVVEHERSNGISEHLASMPLSGKPTVR